MESAIQASLGLVINFNFSGVLQKELPFRHWTSPLTNPLIRCRQTNRYDFVLGLASEFDDLMSS